jgi:hypothetical protein
MTRPLKTGTPGVRIHRLQTRAARSLAGARATAALAAAALLLVGLPTVAGAAPAAADPQGYEEVDHGIGRFYGNFEAQVLLFAAGSAEDICNGGDEPTVPARVYERRDGGTDLKVTARDVPIWLYESPLGAPEFVDQTCGALFDGDPTTEPVQPFAHGTASLKERIEAGPDGVEDHWNGVNGTATSADGTQWKVRSWADFVIDNGVLVGDPAEFQGLAIHEIGN